MTRQEFLTSLDELMELPEGTLQGPEKLDELDGWTSMALVGFIALVDTNNGQRLSPPLIAKCTTVDELLNLAKVEAT